MSIEGAIYDVLHDDATVLGIVVAKIYPNNIPQGITVPAISYHEISGMRDHVLGSATGLVMSRYQINCWDDDYAGVRTLANAVRNALDDYAGTKDSTYIQRALIDGENDISEFPADTQLLFRYGKALDFIIWFNE
jgi:hypothetical protein